MKEFSKDNIEIKQGKITHKEGVMIMPCHLIDKKENKSYNLTIKGLERDEGFWLCKILDDNKQINTFAISRLEDYARDKLETNFRKTTIAVLLAYFKRRRTKINSFPDAMPRIKR